MARLSLVIALAAVMSANAWAGDPEQECIDGATQIDQKLGCLSGVTFQEIVGALLPKGVRQFEIQITQPVDHTDPTAGTFQQKLFLLHRDVAEPMVLQTGGYFLSTARFSILATTFATNQIQVEHRFFGTSVPGKIDWTKLDIRQSADDFHAITVVFKKIYKKKWVNTGASKGGMTSVYHRRFYPADLDGTVADVAPLSFNNADNRYVEFLDGVGGDAYAECRARWKDLQVQLLRHRDEILPGLLEGAGTFTQLDGADVAFEHSVIESSFFFWQYGKPDDEKAGCKALPNQGTVSEMTAWLQGIAPLKDYNDTEVSKFVPYFFQSATQLGGPNNQTAHVEPLRRYQFTVDQYAPRGVNYTYSNAAMHDVDAWVRTEGDQILFIYGEFDPWSAGEFRVSETGKNVRKLIVPKGNHSAKFTMLAENDRATAIQMISAWMGKEPAVTKTSAKMMNDSLDAAELKLLRFR